MYQTTEKSISNSGKLISYFKVRLIIEEIFSYKTERNILNNNFLQALFMICDPTESSYSDVMNNNEKNLRLIK